MHPTATLFFDVCVQRELWPNGVWPLVTVEQARNIDRLFGMASMLGLRQGGIVCHHLSATSEPVATAPIHCRRGRSARDRPVGCMAKSPMQVWGEDENDHAMTLDRTHAIYVCSGCGGAPDDRHYSRAFEHLTAGIRDVVIFGAGVEYGLHRAVDALLRRSIRIHVALDAVGAGDEKLGQLTVAQWKRQGVDGVTIEVLGRMLGRSQILARSPA